MDKFYKRLIIFHSILLSIILLAGFSVFYLFLSSSNKNRVIQLIDKTFIQFTSDYKPNNSQKKTLETIQIKISPEYVQKINELNKLIIEKDYLSQNFKQWFPAQVNFGKEWYEASIRLRGDLNNHWKYPKKSWSLKLKGKFHKGIKEFNLIIPNDKGYAVEELAYQMSRLMNLLTPDSKFVEVNINEIKFGIYHFVEKLSREMIEKQKFPPGHIYKRSDDWLIAHKENLSQHLRGSNEVVYETSFLDSYSDLYSKRFKNFLNLDHTNASLSDIEQYLDIDLFSSWLAINIFFGSIHSTSSENFRLYQNSSTGKIHPMIYDVTPRHLSIKRYFTYHELFNYLYSFPEVYQKVWLNLKRLTDNEKWIQQFNKIADQNMQNFGRSIKGRDIPTYKDFITSHNKNLEILKNNRSLIQKQLNKLFVFTTLSKNKQGVQYNFLIRNPGKYHALGYRIKNFDDIPELKNSTLKKEVLFNSPRPFELLNKNDREGISQILKLKLGTYSKDLLLEPLLQHIDGSAVEIGILNHGIKYLNTLPTSRASTPDFFRKLNTNTYLIPTGNHTIKNTVVLPNKVNLVIEEGTNLKISPEQSLVINGKLTAQGSKESPITISSSSVAPFGVIAVLQAEDVSTLSHVHISNGYESTINGAYYSGMINFYYSDVELNSCNIQQAKADDGLNVKHGNIKIHSSVFQNNASDGFDGDWIEGSIEQSTFLSNGGDGLDISGANVNVSNTQFKKMGDKGISVGENSVIDVEKSLFLHNNIGLASKDKSISKIKGSSLEYNNIALSAYQKKPFFGPAKIELIDCHLNQNIKKQETDEHSTIMFK